MILVKLHQFDPADRRSVRIRTTEIEPRAIATRMGVSIIPLYRDMREDVRMEVWDPGAAVMVPAPGGLEVFVLDGDFGQGGEGFSKYSWLRLPAADTLDAVAGSDGARVWIKSGHLRHVHN